MNKKKHLFLYNLLFLMGDQKYFSMHQIQWRAFNIINSLLTRKQYPNKQDIMSELKEKSNGEINISGRTLDNYIARMRSYFDAPIEYDYQEKGYYYDDDDYEAPYSIDSIPLSEENIETIEMVTSSMNQLMGHSFFKHFSDSLNKVIDLLNVSKEIGGHSNRPFIYFEQKQTLGEKFLPLFLKAIKNSQKIQAKYDDGDQPLELVMLPHILAESDDLWHLIASLQYKNGRRSTPMIFQVGYIETCSLLDDYFMPLAYNPEEELKFIFGMDEPTEEESPQEIILSFEPEAKKEFMLKKFHPTQKILTDNDEEFKISINVFYHEQADDLRREILGWGNEVKVIHPQELKDDIKNILKKSLHHY